MVFMMSIKYILLILCMASCSSIFFTRSSLRFEFASQFACLSRNITSVATATAEQLNSKKTQLFTRLKQSFQTKSVGGEEISFSDIIPVEEMNSALENAQSLLNKSQDQIKSLGWTLIHSNNNFTLYKRRDKTSSNNGSNPSIYLMVGKFDDISPRTFLYSQINEKQRLIWDKTMKEMKHLSKSSLETTKDNSEDVLYYRTKYPWPIKDRDYVLARRCKIYQDRNAIVFVSKATDAVDKPKVDNAVRVDSYWCQSAFISTPPSTKSLKSSKPVNSMSFEQSQPSIQQLNYQQQNHYMNSLMIAGGDVLDRSKYPQHSEEGALHSEGSTSSSSASILSTISSLVSPTRFSSVSFYNRSYDSKHGVDEIRGLKQSSRHITSVDSRQLQSKSHDEIRRLNAKKVKWIHNQHTHQYKHQPEPLHHRSHEQLTQKNGTRSVDDVGVSFVTMFCDNQRVPLPSAIVDLIAKHAENLVPESFKRLHSVALDVENELRLRRKQINTC